MFLGADPPNLVPGPPFLRDCPGIKTPFQKTLFLVCSSLIHQLAFSVAGEVFQVFVCDFSRMYKDCCRIGNVPFSDSDTFGSFGFLSFGRGNFDFFCLRCDSGLARQYRRAGTGYRFGDLVSRLSACGVSKVDLTQNRIPELPPILPLTPVLPLTPALPLNQMPVPNTIVLYSKLKLS